VSRRLSSKLLKSRGAARPAIDERRPCPHCGYDLRGLPLGQACPECGGVDDVRRAAHDVLQSGSPAQRAALRRGFAIATLCLIVALAARLAFLAASLAGWTGARGAYVFVGAANSIAWAAAVWLITPPRIVHRSPELAPARRAARVLAPAFAAGYACIIARELAPAGSSLESWLDAGNMLGRLLGGAGAMILAFVLTVVAGDVERPDAARRFNAVAWILWVPTLLAQAFRASITWIDLIVLAMVLLFWTWLMALFILGMRELWAHAHWAHVLTFGVSGRAARIDQTRCELDAAAAAAIRPLPGTGDDVGLEGPRPRG
jgi:hypothetical protein